MFKYIVIGSLVLTLSSCNFGKSEPTNPTQETQPSSQTENITNGTPTEKNPIVSLNYTLREGSPTGKILETTVESVARENNLYTSGATYSPFELILGSNSVIPGFESGVASMKKGEKKVIEVFPKDGYGEAMMVRSVREGEVAPKFSITADRSRFEDMVTETVQRAMLGEEGKDLIVGQTLTGGANVTAKVTKIEGDMITLSIENKENPFFGKKLEKGLSTKKDGITFTIKDLTDKDITLDIINDNSPFAGKEFVVGATAPMPGSIGTLKVVSMSGDTVELEVPNTHPLGGKTLYFEVEILDIK